MPVPAILATLATDPVWGPLLAEMGTGVVNKFLGFGGQSPGEQANQQRLGAAQTVFPDLRKAAAGLPTASSNAIMRQVRQEGTSMQQSMAASARGAGMLGGTQQGGSSFRAESERMQNSNREIMAQRLGQHQISAQQMLLGQLGPAIEQENQFAGQDQKADVFVKGVLGKLGRRYAQNPNDERINRFIDVIEKLGIGGAAGDPSNTATPGLPFAQQFTGQPTSNLPFAQQFTTG